MVTKPSLIQWNMDSSGLDQSSVHCSLFRSHGGRFGGTADHPVNSGRRQQIVMLINLPHSLFIVRWYTTVKEVRSHSERGKAAVPRVVGTVATLSYCGMRVTARVTSWVRAPCGGSLADPVERRPAPEP